MQTVLLTVFLAMLTSVAHSQNSCNEPELVLPDTVGNVISPVLQKRNGCNQSFTYRIKSYRITIGNGSSASSIRVARGPVTIGSDARSGDRVTIEIIEAERELNGQRQNLPLGKWARKTTVFRKQ